MDYVGDYHHDIDKHKIYVFKHFLDVDDQYDGIKKYDKFEYVLSDSAELNQFGEEKSNYAYMEICD